MYWFVMQQISFEQFVSYLFSLEKNKKYYIWTGLYNLVIIIIAFSICVCA